MQGDTQAIDRQVHGDGASSDYGSAEIGGGSEGRKPCDGGQRR